jgi:hypothetical protein
MYEYVWIVTDDERGRFLGVFNDLIGARLCFQQSLDVTYLRRPQDKPELVRHSHDHYSAGHVTFRKHRVWNESAHL